MKITEVTVTDERGQDHTLRCTHGLDMDADPEEGLFIATVRGVQPHRSLVFPSGRYICYRVTCSA